MVYCNAVDLNRWMSGKNNYIGFSVTSNTCLAIDHVREEKVNIHFQCFRVFLSLYVHMSTICV